MSNTRFNLHADHTIYTALADCLDLLAENGVVVIPYGTTLDAFKTDDIVQFIRQALDCNKLQYMLTMWTDSVEVSCLDKDPDYLKALAEFIRDLDAQSFVAIPKGRSDRETKKTRSMVQFLGEWLDELIVSHEIHELKTCYVVEITE